MAAAQRPVLFSSSSGYRAPLDRDLRGGAVDLLQILGRELDRSRPDVLVQALQLPGAGIGTIHGFWASSQASAICAGVAFFRSAMVRSRSTRAWFAFRASGVKRGTMLRKSDLSNVVFSSIFPVRKPLPRGLKGTNPIPSSSSVGSSFLFRASPPQRVFALDGGDRLDRVGAADRLHSCFRKAEVLHLAFPNQVLHRSCHVFDRHVRVDAVLIVTGR